MSRKTYVPTFILCALLMGQEVYAQPKDTGMDRFIQLASNDAGYKKFQSELRNIIAGARGRNGNFAAARSLFSRQSGMLNGIYRRAGMKEPGGNPTSRVRTTKPQYLSMKSRLIGTHAKPIGRIGFIKTGGYDFSWQQRNFPNGNMPNPFDTTGSSKMQGKQFITSTDICTYVSYCYLGTYRRGFGETVSVPNDPEILAARVTFEYSFEYDAWDSHNGKSAVDLLLHADDKFKSDDVNGLPLVLSYAPPYEHWKKVATLMAPDSIAGNIGEYHASANSSFSIEGYVTPGTNLEFRLGFGFPAGTKRGTNGNYHYAEFHLKKITVTYFKSIQ